MKRKIMLSKNLCRYQNDISKAKIKMSKVLVLKTYGFISFQIECFCTGQLTPFYRTMGQEKCTEQACAQIGNSVCSAELKPG